jgi:hypothetical protein
VTDQIRSVMSFTETPRLDYVINQALAGDTWYSKPDNDNTIAEDWFKGLINDLSDVSIDPTKKNQPSKADKLVKSKPLPSSSNIKKKNQIASIHDDAHKCAIIETIGREVRMAERYAIQKGDSFEVNLQTWGHIKHTKQNPLWEVPRFCYLAAINIAILWMADKLQYLIKDTSLQSWANIKSQFDVSGPAAIFVDFKFVINFKFDDRKEPAIQVAELNTRLNRLATHGFNLDYRIQAMIILSGLPQSWDSVQGSILANHNMADLSISVIMPILQEEWQRHQARRGDHKSSHLARGGMHGAPQRQHWQGNQNNSGYTLQAGPSNYNSSYKPAPYKKFGPKKPNYKPNNQNPGYNSNNSGSKGPNGPNWERNRQNCQNKKQARMLLKEQVAKLESQSKPDTKGKKKEKAGKSANLLA